MSRPESPAPDETGLSGATPDELRQRIAVLTEQLAARDTFIAVAGHELRNPITPMIGQVELLLAALQAGRCSPAQVEQRLKRIRRAMELYVRRLTSLLDVSRITTGNLKLEPGPCDLAAMLREAAETFAEPSRYAASPIRLTTPPQLRGTWDCLALEQVIDNLLSNAIKYGRGKPIELIGTESGDRVCVVVRDHGPGISAEDRRRIFERFERVIGHERHSGFGLGLWVVGHLVAGMGGEVSVEEAQGGGAAFRVTLPRHMAAVHS